MEKIQVRPFCDVAEPAMYDGTKSHAAETVALASALHEMWRRGFEAANGVGAVRMKDDGAGGECNINAPYAALPSKWQAENLSAASHAVAVSAYLLSQLSEASFYGVRRSDDELVELIAEQVHVAWLERNGAWAPAELAVPYADLTDEEQEKDRVIARLALSSVRPNN
jgi:hypothetical protein